MGIEAIGLLFLMDGCIATLAGLIGKTHLFTGLAILEIGTLTLIGIILID